MDLRARMATLGVTHLSPIIADADSHAFGGFDLRSWAHLEHQALADRSWRSVNRDFLTARLEGAVLLASGGIANGSRFGCVAGRAWLTLPDFDKVALRGFRGTLRQLIDVPLLARDEYRVVSVDTIAGASLIRFECPLVTLDEYLGANGTD